MNKRLDVQFWTKDAQQQLHDLYTKAKAVVDKPYQISEAWIWNQMCKRSSQWPISIDSDVSVL